MQNDVSRIMVEIAVRQALKNRSKQSFRRSLRTLVEYGEHFSSGPFQSQFFVLVQQMLRDENHPYYLLAERAWAQVDKRYLEHFCLNMGYESWTRGAAVIRALEAKMNCNIPWCLVIERTRPTGESLAEEHICSLMEQGMRMGIFTYFLVDCQLDAALIRRLASSHGACALICITLDSCLTEDALTLLDDATNLMLAPVLDGETFLSAPRMRERRRLYGLCTSYASLADAQRLAQGDGLACPGDPDCMLRFFFPAENCAPEVCNEVDTALLRLKEHPLTAQFPVELTQDLRRIDQIISTDDCALSVRPSGEFMISWPEIPTGLYAQSTSLEELIRTRLQKA